jgi:flagellar assembly protein FliH
MRAIIEMPDSDLIKAVRSIGQDWQLEARIKKAAELYHEKEIKRLQEQVADLEKQAAGIISQANDEARLILDDARSQASVLIKREEDRLKRQEKKLQDDFAAKENELLQKQNELEAVRAEVLEGREKSLAEGRSEGYDVGYAEGFAQFSEMMESVKGVIQSVISGQEAYYESQVPHIQKFVKLYAEKIVGVLGETTVNCVLHNISQAAQALSRANKLKLVVSDYDYEILSAMEENFRRLFAATTKVELLKDPNMVPGGCFLESELGSVDATIESQLAILKKELHHD